MQYRIIHGNTAALLQAAVLGFMTDNPSARPIGGPFYAQGFFYQAMLIDLAVSHKKKKRK